MSDRSSEGLKSSLFFYEYKTTEDLIISGVVEVDFTQWSHYMTKARELEREIESHIERQGKSSSSGRLVLVKRI